MGCFYFGEYFFQCGIFPAFFLISFELCLKVHLNPHCPINGIVAYFIHEYTFFQVPRTLANCFDILMSIVRDAKIPWGSERRVGSLFSLESLRICFLFAAE